MVGISGFAEGERVPHSKAMGVQSGLRATCLCGAVTLTATKVAPEFTACHCGMCRRWGGGPLLTVECGDDVRIEGSESVAVFDSSKWAERGFCKSCGTHLFYRLKHSQQYEIPLGLFGDKISPSFRLQVFIDRKPPGYAFADDTEELTEAEVYEKYAPKS